MKMLIHDKKKCLDGRYRLERKKNKVKRNIKRKKKKKQYFYEKKKEKIIFSSDLTETKQRRNLLLFFYFSLEDLARKKE